MSFVRSNRPVVTLVVVAVLLALTAPPAHAAGSILDTLGARMQSWAANLWPWPAAADHGIVAANPDGGARSNLGAVHGSRPGHGGGQPGRAVLPPVTPLGCIVGDPNGCPH
jgi:hypothetical protein